MTLEPGDQLLLKFRVARTLEPGDQLVLRFNQAGTPVDPEPPVEPPPLVGAIRMRTGLRWGVAAAAPQRVVAAPWGLVQGRRRKAWALPFGRAPMRRGATALAWGYDRLLRPPAVAMPWNQTPLANAHVAAPWDQSTLAAAALATRWQPGALVARPVAAPWQRGTAGVRHAAAAWTLTERLTRRVAALASIGRLVQAAVAAPWGPALRLISWGGHWTPPEPLLPPLQTCRTDDPGDQLLMLFSSAERSQVPLRLVFFCRRPAVVVVPIRRVYMIFNAATLVRVSDGATIPARRMSLSLDVDSWCWGFTAEVEHWGLALLQPGVDGNPVALQATFNGTPVRVLAESISRSRVFARESLISVAGRGISAALADPYQAVSTFSNVLGPLTSQQLVDQALPAGWSAEFGLTPWVVPTGMWSHQGTPMTAVLAVAAAAGGYVQPHDLAQQLLVLPRYPAPPWQWASMTPDIALPSAVAQRESVEWVARPGYDRVYVSGAAAGGVLGRVTRLGTAGAMVAPMVVDPLITHADAARQRGLQVLSDTGRQAFVTWRLPVLPETGLIRPGKLLRLTDGAESHLGLVRGLRVDHEGGSKLWQTVRVESHVG